MTIANGGNVGIGTSNPNAQLQVGGSSQMSNPIISARGAGRAALEFGHGNPNGYGSSIGATEPNGMPYLGFNTEAESAGNTFITRGIVGRVMYADLTGGVKFARVTNPSAAGQTLTDDVIINSSGNVGIGTTTPTSKLQVTSGDVYVQTQGNGIILRDTDGAGCHRITVNTAGTIAANVVACP
jgi:hypothetical protein